MKHKKTYIAITDNKVYILENDKIIVDKYNSKIMNINHIKNEELLLKLFKNILKKHQLNKNIMNNDLYIMSNFIYKTQKEILTNVFTKLSFNKIKFISYQQLDKKLVDSKCTLVINLFSKNMIIKLYANKKLLTKLCINYKYLLTNKISKNIIKYIEKFLKFKNISIEKTLIYGDSKKLKLVANLLQKKHNMNYIANFEQIFGTFEHIS